MATLISAGNSEGEYGRCDAKCYNTVLPRCDCICGGANHGKGLKAAMEWIRAHGEALAQRTGVEISLPML